MRATTKAGVVALTASLLAACGSSSAPAATAKSPFRILMILDLTGLASYYGQASEHAFRAAANVINESGGMDGHQVVISVFDDQGDPTKDVSILTAQLDSGTTYNLCECGTLGASTVALLPIAAKANLLMTESASTTAGDDPAMYPDNFGPQPAITYQTQELVNYVMTNDYTRVGILTSSDLTGQTELSDIEPQFAKLPGVTLTTDVYNLTGLDFTGDLQKVQAGNPQIVILFSHGAATGIILRDRAKVGWTTPLIADIGSTAVDLTKLVPQAQLVNVLEQHRLIDVSTDPLHSTAGFKAMYNGIVAQGPLNETLSSYSVMYDALTYFATAVRQAGSTDPSKVVDALQNLKDPNPLPWFTFQHAPGFSSTQHFVVAEPTDFTITGLTHLLNGLDVPIQGVYQPL